MWEWRVFHEITVFNLEQQLQKYSEEAKMKFKTAKPEIWVDYYFDLKDPKYGLKERWNKIARVYFPQFELKIREKRDKRSRCELWRKVINRPIEGTFDKRLTIKQMLGILNTSEIKNKKGLMTRISQIKPRHVAVHKERIQIKAKFDKTKDIWSFHHVGDHTVPDIYIDDTVLVEQTMLPKIQSSMYALQSICCEASNIEIINKFIEEFIVLTDEQPMGYPEFLIFLLN
ncbi:MAG: hypothetical protein ACXAB7_08360 [Candidatus Kariarchaeaceae archaeon]|jgi:hypothetical protein